MNKEEIIKEFREERNWRQILTEEEIKEIEDFWLSKLEAQQDKIISRSIDETAKHGLWMNKKKLTKTIKAKLVMDKIIKEPFKDLDEEHEHNDAIEHFFGCKECDKMFKKRVEKKLKAQREDLLKKIEEGFIIFERPISCVRDFLAQDCEGNYHKLKEINPNQSLKEI